MHADPIMAPTHIARRKTKRRSMPAPRKMKKPGLPRPVFLTLAGLASFTVVFGGIFVYSLFVG